MSYRNVFVRVKFTLHRSNLKFPKDAQQGFWRHLGKFRTSELSLEEFLRKKTNAMYLESTEIMSIEVGGDIKRFVVEKPTIRFDLVEQPLSSKQQDKVGDEIDWDEEDD